MDKDTIEKGFLERFLILLFERVRWWVVNDFNS